MGQYYLGFTEEEDEPTKEYRNYFEKDGMKYGFFMELWDYPNNRMKPDYSVWCNIWNTKKEDRNLYFMKTLNSPEEARKFFETVVETFENKQLVSSLEELNFNGDAIDLDVYKGSDRFLSFVYDRIRRNYWNNKSKEG